jgi:hypothetical protein
MTDEDVVRRAATAMGTDKVVPRGPYGSLSKKVQYWAVVYGARAEAVMLAVRPHMGNRRGECIDALLSLPNLSHIKHPVVKGTALA